MPKKMNEIENSIFAIMNEFKEESSPGQDRQNFDILKNVNKELMTRAVAGEFETSDFTPFLNNFLREFDNTYEKGLPEAIIASLKSGKRTELTKEWWSRGNEEKSD